MLRSRVLIAVSWCCVAVAAWFLVSVRLGVSNSGSLLTIDPSALDLGTVWPEPDFEVYLPVTNGTQRSITIDRFQTSCECSRIEPAAIEVPAGATKTIIATIDLSQLAGSEVIDVSIRPLSNDFAPATIWRITGRVQSPFVGSYPTVDLGTIVCGVPNAADREIATTQQLASVSVRGSEHFQEVAARVGSNGSDVLLSFLTKTDKGKGDSSQARGFVDLQLVTAAGSTLPWCRIAVAFVVVPDIQPTPTRVELGLRDVGEIVSTDILVYSRTNRKFSVLSVTASGEGIKAAVIHKDRVRVVQVIQDVPEGSSLVRINVGGDTDEESNELEVPVFYAARSQL